MENLPPEAKKQLLISRTHCDYEDMLMNAPIGVFSVTPCGRFAYANSALALMFGYSSPQELIDSTENVGAQLYADPQDSNRIRRLLDKNNERLNFECCLVRRDGSLFWGSYNARAVRDENGNIVYYQGFLSDITERKDEKEALQRTKFAMDRAPDSIFWVDHQGCIIYANDAACASLGYSREEFLAITVFDIDPDFPSGQWERHKEEMQRLGSMTFETYLHTKEGLRLPFEIIVDHFYYKELFLACAYCRDISQRKRTEEVLKYNEGILRSMLEATLAGVALLKDREFKRVNKSLCTITGYSEEEMMGMKTRAILPDDEEYQRIGHELYEEMARKGLGVKETVLKRKDGEIINVILSLSPFDPYDFSAGVCATVQDITDRKQAEKALIESERKYRALSIVDSLTRLYNSRHFYNQLQMEIRRAERYEQPLTLLLIDIDNFKDFNDTYGHLQGDRVLSQFGKLVKRLLRQTDSAYRYGGEEFTVLLPMTSRVDGVVAAERIITEFRKEEFSPVSGRVVHMTVSVGVAQYKPGEGLQSFVDQADQLMYQAKKNGKNRVCVG